MRRRTAKRNGDNETGEVAMVFEESEPESITIEQALAAVKSMKESGDELNANINSRRDSAESLKKFNEAMANHARSHGVLINWAVQALARIESERAERAKPIDAEWCKANGAISLTPDFAFFRIPDGHNVNVYLDPIDPHVAYGSNSFPAVTTRGQLLDLLAALNGGAS